MRSALRAAHHIDLSPLAGLALDDFVENPDVTQLADHSAVSEALRLEQEVDRRHAGEAQNTTNSTEDPDATP